MHLTPLVKRLLILWATLWVLGFLTGGSTGGLQRWLDLDPRGISSFDFLSLPGIFGYVLIHSQLSIFHLLVNGYMFALFAPEIERVFPGERFLRLLGKACLAGAASTLILYWLMPHTFDAPVIGGSGLVSAVFAASAALYPERLLNLLFLRLRLITFFLFLTGLDLLFFFGNLLGRADGVAHHVHLAGALVGWMAVGGFQRLDGPWRAWIEKANRRKAAKQQRQNQDLEAELDRILAKISRDGLPSLTAAERRFLEHRSKR